MRIVHIADRFYAQAGYLLNILAKYEVKEGHEVIIISSQKSVWDKEKIEFWDGAHADERDAKFEEATGVIIHRHPARKVIASRVIYNRDIFDYVDGQKPDVVFIHSESSYCALSYLHRIKRVGFPIVLGSHMMELAAQSKFRELFYFFYKAYFARIIKNNSVLMIRVQDEDYAIRKLGVPKKNAPLISFGSDLDLFHPDDKKRCEIRKKYDIASSDFVVIVTGKLNRFKGGMLLAKAFEKRFDTKRNVVLITVGTITNDDYGKEVGRLFENSQNRIIRIPTQDYCMLPQYYQCADISVFARECSLSFYDAQACGLPVVLEDNELNIDRVSHGNGAVFKSGSVKSLSSMICRFAEMPEEEYDKYHKNAIRLIRENYDYKDISAQYTALLQKSVDSFSKKIRKKP